MRTDWYRNLHGKHAVKWSGRSRERASYGRVIAREAGTLVKDVTFVVSQAGRARVLREGQKNVHAVVRGEALPHVAIDFSDPLFDLASPNWRQAHYNPFDAGSFMTHYLMPLHSAPLVWLHPNGCAYYWAAPMSTFSDMCSSSLLMCWVLSSRMDATAQCL
jgi:hypothetical protein